MHALRVFARAQTAVAATNARVMTSVLSRSVSDFERGPLADRERAREVCSCRPSLTSCAVAFLLSAFFTFATARFDFVEAILQQGRGEVASRKLVMLLPSEKRFLPAFVWTPCRSRLMRICVARTGNS